MPENSLLAFAKAIERGSPIELDVHVTADKNVVVIHDEPANQMTSGNGCIEEMNN